MLTKPLLVGASSGIKGWFGGRKRKQVSVSIAIWAQISGNELLIAKNGWRKSARWAALFGNSARHMSHYLVVKVKVRIRRVAITHKFKQIG